jgi:hypothetical protein
MCVTAPVVACAHRLIIIGFKSSVYKLSPLSHVKKPVRRSRFIISPRKFNSLSNLVKNLWVSVSVCM